MSPTDQPHAWGKSLGFWTTLLLVWLMAITVTGAVVRLTGSGLGCTDWPTCNANEELDEPGFHSAIEFGNRIISGLAIIPLIAAWKAARGTRPDLQLVLWASLAGFVGQVLLGMLVTRTELDPRVVLGHFLLSIVLVFLAVILVARTRPLFPSSPAVISAANYARNRRLAQLLVALCAVLITVGTLVTGSGPHTGSDESGEAIERLGFDIREITRVHSIIAWVFLAAVVFTALHLRKSGGDLRTITILATACTAQGGIGYAQYYMGVPELLVGIHIAGAVVLWTATVGYWTQYPKIDRVDRSPTTEPRAPEFA